jgi:hypothetical protein
MAGIGPRTCCAELGASVHLAHPLGVKGFAYRRVKNDLLTELPDRSSAVRAAFRCGWLGSVLVINDGDVPRELSGLGGAAARLA